MYPVPFIHPIPRRCRWLGSLILGGLAFLAFAAPSLAQDAEEPEEQPTAVPATAEPAPGEPGPVEPAPTEPEAAPAPAPVDNLPTTPTRKKAVRPRPGAKDATSQPAGKPDRPGRRSSRRTPAKPATPAVDPALPNPEDINAKPGVNPIPDPMNPTVPPTVAPAEELESDIDAEFEQLQKPAEERTYSFSIQDGTYADLVRAFSRMSGLGILGSTPEDTLTYVSTEKMDYNAALSRVRELLFKHPENFYMWRKGNSLELIRMTEGPRHMPLDRIYTSVEAFKEADLDEMELVMVVYTPEGDPGGLDRLRDFMPDYARIAPYENKNAITIFALVGDVNKYLELVGIFKKVKDDPREFKVIKTNHILPSLACDMLPQIMPSFNERGAGAAPPAQPAPRPGRKTPQPDAGQSLGNMQGQTIDLVPYDSMSTLFVRAMSDKIAEVEEYLTFIDVKAADVGDPVVIPLKHVRVEQMITILGPLFQGGGPAPVAVPATPEGQPAPVKRGRRQPARAMTGTSVVTDSVGLHANPANNTLIVIANEEDLAEVREYVALYDIPTEDTTVRVTLTHADAATLVQPVQDILANIQPQGTPRAVHVMADPAGNGLVISGTLLQVELAKKVVADLDVEDPEGRPTLHVFKCKHAQPSFLVGILNTYDASSAAPAQVMPQPQPQPVNPDGQPQQVKKPVRPKRAPARTVGAGKFHANDETKTLFIICNDTEWKDTYKPTIEMLEADSAGPEGITVIPVENAPVEELVAALNQAFGGQVGVPGQPSSGGPMLLARPEGVMVLDASEEEIEKLTALTKALDTAADETRRTFTLKHANPADVKATLEAILLKGAASSPSPRRTPKATPGQPGAPVVAMPSASGQSDIQIIESGRRDLIVVASPKRMPEIEQLIAELDVDPINAEVRVYDFPPGANVQEIAGSLSSLHPGGVAVNPAAPGAKGPQAPRAGGGDGDVRFIPQIAARKIVVSAPADMFEAIEKNIDLFKAGNKSEESTVEFFELQHANSESIANILQPILETKYADLVADGTLPESVGAPQPGGRGQGAGKAQVSVTADPQGHGVIVVAPKPLQDLVPPLLAKFDRTGEDRIMRTVQLERADPGEMVQAITTMLSGRSGGGAPRMPGAGGVGRNRPNRGASSRPSAVVASAQSQDVTVVAAPGGSAVVISGLTDAVEEVETWVKELDASSTGGKQIKIYSPKIVEVDKFADVVMAMVDSGRGTTPAKGKEETEDDWFADSSAPLVGKDIVLVPDSWGGTIVASASPTKLREIDALFEMYEGKDGKPPAFSADIGLPYTTHELQHRDDTYDAVYELENIIDTLWTGSDKPKVDYISWTKIIVIKGKPDQFKEVEELITKYVDKPSESKSLALGPQLKTKYVKGMPAAELLWLLKTKMGDNLDLKNVPLPGHGTDNNMGIEQVIPGVEQVAPAVLPASAFAVLATALQEAPPASSQPGASSPQFDKSLDAEKEKIRQSMSEQAKQPPVDIEAAPPTAPQDEPAASTSAKGESAPAPAAAEVSQIIRATVDPERNVLLFEGARDGLKDIDDWIDEIMEELKGSPQPPDIRVFRLKHVDVNSAATVLENMFNAGGGGGRQQPMNARQMQQQMQQMQLQQQIQQMRMQQQQPGGKAANPLAQLIPGADDEKGGKSGSRSRRDSSGRGGDEEESPDAVAEAAQQEEAQIRVFPDGRTRTLIIRAATEQYPSIIKLLATIDQKGTGPAEFRIYQLKKLNAADVEATLKGMLGLDQASTSAASSQRRQMNPQMNRMQAQMNQMGLGNIPLLLDMGLDGEAVALDSSNQVRISSSPDTNTILAMAPEKTLDLIGKLIDQLEDQQSALYVTEFVPLQHGDAEEVVAQLEAVFGRGGRTRGGAAAAGGEAARSSAGGGYNPLDVNNPVFVADTRTNRVVVRALELDLPKIKPLIDKFDVDGGGKREVFSQVLENGDAAAIARVLQEVYTPKAAGGKQPSAAKAVKITGEQTSNTIFVDAPPTLKDEILAKIKDMDSGAAESRKPKSILLRNAKPTAIATKLQEAFGGRSGRSGQVKFTGDDASMQLFVTAPPSTFADVQEMVARLDIIGPGLEIKLYPLQHARAADTLQKMKEMVAPIVAAGKSSGIDLGVFSATADDRTNTVVVAGNPAVFAIVDKVLPKVDVAPTATPISNTKVFTLATAQAAEVANTINGLFQGRRDVVDPPKVQAMPSTNQVLVTGTEVQIAEIEEHVIKKLEEGAGTNAQVREIYQVQNARAAELANVVTQSLQARSPGRTGPTVTVVANEAHNQLVLVGIRKDIDDVKPIIQLLDQKAEDQRIVKTFKMTYGEAGALAEPVKQLFRSTGARPSPRDQVDAYPDWSSNSLVVSASPENMTKIEELVKQFDNPTSGERAVHVIEITNGDAASVAQSLIEIFVNRGRNQRGQETISISNPRGTSSLMVKANEKELGDIKAVIASLESGAPGWAGEIKVVPLKFTDATETQTILQEYLRKPGQQAGRGPGAELAGDVRLSVSADTNSLVISGATEEIAKLEAVIAKIDVQVDDPSNTPQIIKLQHATASVIQPSIEELFGQQAQRGRAGGRGNTSQPPVIVGDDGSNSLIVRASRVDFNAIQGLVKTLDTEGANPGGGIKIVSVASGVNISDLAALVEDSLNTTLANRQSRGQRGGPREEIKVSADSRTNSIILAGARSVFGEAEQMIRELEKMGPVGDRKTMIIPLRNMGVDEMRGVLEQMIQDNGSGTGSQRSTTPRRQPTRPRSR